MNKVTSNSTTPSNLDIEKAQVALQEFLGQIEKDHKYGLINLFSRLILNRLIELDPSNRDQYEALDFKWKLYEKFLWLTLKYCLDEKKNYSSEFAVKIKQTKDSSVLITLITEEMKANQTFSLDFCEGAILNYGYFLEHFKLTEDLKN